MKRIIVAIASITAVGVLTAGFATPAWADDPTGAQTFRTTTVRRDGADPIRIVVASGVISSVGREVILDQNQGPDGSNVVDAEFVFPQGTVFVTMTFTVDFSIQGPPVCMATTAINGTFVITGGTGAFQGASGSGTLTGVGRSIVPFDRSTNDCNTDVTIVNVNHRTLDGTISIPDASAAA
jgi:hypothetical protein